MNTAKHMIFYLLIFVFLCVFPLKEVESNLDIGEEPLDYSSSDNWIVYADGENTDSDFFIIAPTVATGDEYIMPLDETTPLASFLAQTNVFREIFGPTSRAFSPLYRQVTTKTYDLPREDWEPYMKIAYRDVSAAFEYYLKNENDGRPIILMGFSQGADMGIRLMQEYFDDEQLASRLVAAYFIGTPITAEMTEKYPQLKMAQREEDTGVIISFDCETPEVKESVLNPAGQKILSINPLNWKTDSTPADKSLNKGSRLLNGRGELKREATELCGAYIDPDRGVLKVTDIDAADYKPVLSILSPGVLHVYDTQLFYQNLKDNAALRLQNYLNAHDN
ncbi:MAG: DUF3089 domain-containing protein [Anaerolineaceae bacterium]|nr:DUF3089 domain-containing protein [Anaerolineaceae bacterium]